MDECIFCKIVRGEVPAKKVYEDAEILAFNDIRPQAPVHFMLIPKKHIDSLAAVGAEDAGMLGRLLALSGRLARWAQLPRLLDEGGRPRRGRRAPVDVRRPRG